jgi:hypothetical protein
LNIYAIGDEKSKRPAYVKCLAEQYNVPVIKLRETFEYVEANCEDEELIADLKEESDNIKNILADNKCVGHRLLRTLVLARQERSFTDV